jgi:hypothetical protein
MLARVLIAEGDIMAILLHCSCGTKLSVDDSLAGKKTRCPRCREIVMVPAMASPASAAEPDEEPILGVPVDPSQEKIPPADDETPILGVTLEPGRGKKPSPSGKAPLRSVILERGRSRTRPHMPPPAPVWPWVVGGVAGSCLLLGAVIAVIWVLSDEGNPPPIVKVQPPVWKEKKDFWFEEKEDFDAGKNDWPKKDWQDVVKDKKLDPPFRPVEPIVAELVNGRYEHRGQILWGDFFALCY